jgi:hypothetical protein
MIAAAPRCCAETPPGRNPNGNFRIHTNNKNASSKTTASRPTNRFGHSSQGEEPRTVDFSAPECSPECPRNPEVHGRGREGRPNGRFQARSQWGRSPNGRFQRSGMRSGVLPRSPERPPPGMLSGVPPGRPNRGFQARSRWGRSPNGRFQRIGMLSGMFPGVRESPRNGLRSATRTPERSISGSLAMGKNPKRSISALRNALRSASPESGEAPGLHFGVFPGRANGRFQVRPRRGTSPNGRFQRSGMLSVVFPGVREAPRNALRSGPRTPERSISGPLAWGRSPNGRFQRSGMFSGVPPGIRNSGGFQSILDWSLYCKTSFRKSAAQIPCFGQTRNLN